MIRSKLFIALAPFICISLLTVHSAAFASAKTIDISRDNEITLTIYQNPFALVRDVRNVELNRGVNRLNFTGFPTSLQYGSLITRFDGKIFDIDFDTNRPGFESFMRSLVGETVRFDHHSGSSVSGILVQYSPNLVVVKQSDGSNVIIRDLGNYTVSSNAALPSVEGYPMLRMSAEVRRAGTQKLDIYYLMHGLRWTAEYALIISDDEKNGTLAGWAILENRTDMGFDNVKIQLIAGELNIGRGGPSQPRPEVMMRAATMETMDLSAPETPVAEQFSEYQRYDLQGRFSLKSNNQHRFDVLDSSPVEIRKSYRYTSRDQRMEFPVGGQIRVLMDILQKNASAQPLPGGVVKIYQEKGGQLLLIGEDKIHNISAGARVQVTSGFAFDILVQENPKSYNRISDRIQEQENEIVLVNNRNEDVIVEIERAIHPNQRISKSTIPHEMLSANRAVFKVPVAKGSSAALNFTIRTER